MNLVSWYNIFAYQKYKHAKWYSFNDCFIEALACECLSRRRWFILPFQIIESIYSRSGGLIGSGYQISGPDYDMTSIVTTTMPTNQSCLYIINYKKTSLFFNFLAIHYSLYSCNSFWNLFRLNGKLWRYCFDASITLLIYLLIVHRVQTDAMQKTWLSEIHRFL